jgi:hypothetical protein
MNDLAIKRAEPVAVALTNAVYERDTDAIQRLLTPLRVDDLYALAVVLADRLPPTITDADRIRDAAEILGQRFGTERHGILSSSRRREDLDARACLMYVGHLLGMSYSAVGRQVSRDHSTVMHAIGRVGENPRLRAVAEQVAARLGWDREEDAS